MAQVRQDCDERIASAEQEKRQRIQEEVAAKQALEKEKNEEIAKLNASIETLQSEAAELQETILRLQAENKAISVQSGKKDLEEMSSKELFATLEEQKKAFDAYYKKQWSLAKKRIREESLKAPDPKKKKKKRGEEDEQA